MSNHLGMNRFLFQLLLLDESPLGFLFRVCMHCMQLVYCGHGCTKAYNLSKLCKAHRIRREPCLSISKHEAMNLRTMLAQHETQIAHVLQALRVTRQIHSPFTNKCVAHEELSKPCNLKTRQVASTPTRKTLVSKTTHMAQVVAFEAHDLKPTQEARAYAHEALVMNNKHEAHKDICMDHVAKTRAEDMCAQTRVSLPQC